jgi:hypothetical protein
MNDVNTELKTKSKTKTPRKKSHNLGKLSADYEVLKEAMAKAADVPADQVSLDGLNPAMKKAEADIAKIIGVPTDKIKVSIILCE